MSEQEKQLKRIVDLLDFHLGDSDNYLPDEPMTPSEFEEEYPVVAAMQIAVKLMMDARSAPTQGADARPVAITEGPLKKLGARLAMLLDEDQFNGIEPLLEACVLATRDAAPYLPCPICNGVEGCDHTVPERRRAASDAALTDAPTIEYQTGVPTKTGVYACKAPFDAMERAENSHMTRNEFLVWSDGHWSYCGSDQRNRGTILGWIGPLPRFAASAPKEKA